MVSDMRQLATVAAVLIVLAVPVVTWWLVGNQSTMSQFRGSHLPGSRTERRQAGSLSSTGP
jgi:hypothetical protein